MLDNTMQLCRPMDLFARQSNLVKHWTIAFLAAALTCGSAEAAELDLLPSVIVNPANAQVRLKQIASITLPSDLAPVPDGSGRLFVTDLTGTIRVIDGSGSLLASPYHTMAGTQTILDRDTAFTSIAFHPGFSNPASAGYGKFYTLEPEKPGTATATFSPKFSSVGTNYHHQNVFTNTRCLIPRQIRSAVVLQSGK